MDGEQKRGITFQAVHETRWQPPSNDDDDDYGVRRRARGGGVSRGEGLAAGVSRALRSAFDSLYNNMTEMSVN